MTAVPAPPPAPAPEAATPPMALAAEPAPGQAARNPAQAAYEALRESQTTRIGGGRAFGGWGVLTPAEREDFYAAANAVAAPLNAELARLRAEAASLREQLAGQQRLLANHKRAAALSHQALAHQCDDLRDQRDQLAERNAAVASERDAHRLRADHYEGLWRAEHGLPAEEGAPPVTPLDTALQHVREARQFLGERNRYRKALEAIAAPCPHQGGGTSDWCCEECAEEKHRIAREALNPSQPSQQEEPS